MDRRNHIGIVIIVVIIIFDVMVYQYQGEGRYDVTICYPAGKIQYDSLDIVNQNETRVRSEK